MKKILFNIIFILISVFVNAQDHDIIWQQCYGGSLFDGATSGCIASDTGYIIGGHSFSSDGNVSGNNGDRDYWVIKLDTLGTLQWQKSLGGSDNDALLSINSTSDGGYIAAGFSDSNNGDVSGNHGESDCWIVKLNDVGSIQWQKSLGGSEYETANYSEQTLDGGYIVAGWSSSNDGDVSGNYGGSDYWIVKLSDVGDIQWQKSLGGSYDDRARTIMQLVDGSYIVAGNSKSNDGDVSMNQGMSDIWVVKLDNLGNLQWEKSYGGSGTDYPSNIVQSSNGRFTISGFSFSNDGDVSGGHGNYDFWILEIDSTGNLLWQKCYGGSGSDQAKCLRKTADGGSIIVGGAGSVDGDIIGNHGAYDCWVIKIDSIGNLEWQQCYGGSDFDKGHWLFQNLNGNYIIPGWTESNDGNVSGNHGDFDFWVFEIDSDTNNLPTIGDISSIIGPDSICQGTLHKTYYIETILNATAYTWNLEPDIADSIITNDTAATIYFQSGYSDFSTLSVFGSNNSGNSDTSYLYIDIINYPTSNAGSDTIICENSNHTLNGAANNYNHVYWNTLGDGSFDDPFLLNATYTPGNEDVISGSANLIMFAFAISPCLGEVGDTLNLAISYLPEVNAGDNDTICAGSSYLTNGAADYYSSVNWTTSGDGSFNDTTQLSNYYLPGSNDIINGSVYLILTASSLSPCVEPVSDTTLISILTVPSQPNTPQGPEFIDLGTTLSSEYFTFTVENAFSYQWYIEPADAGIINGIDTSAIVNWNESFIGLVSYIYVEAMNECGVTYSDSLIVDISPVGLPLQIEKPKITISPNPSTGIFNISFKGLEEYVDLYISNANGVIIRHERIFISNNESVYRLDLSDKSSGIYYIKFVFKNTESKEKVLIIR